MSAENPSKFNGHGDAVRQKARMLFRNGHGILNISRRLRVARSTLHRWRRAAARDGRPWALSDDRPKTVATVGVLRDLMVRLAARTDVDSHEQVADLETLQRIIDRQMGRGNG